MNIEYLVLQSFPEKGPFAFVRSDKLNKSWDLQEALDELGQEGWELCTTIYGPTGVRGANGDHFCEGFILKRAAL